MPMHSYTRDVIAFVKAHEGEWIDAIRFEQFGRQAWRTRISEARLQLQESGEGTIENRQKTMRDHAVNCPGIQAWDEPEACNCGRSRRWTLSQYRFVRTVREPEQLTLDEARA